MPSGGQNKIRSPENDAIVIERLSQGKSITEAAEAVGVSIGTVQQWRLKDALFDNECSRALDLGYEIQADSLVTIPDTYADVQKARLKSENIRWLLARRAAHRYGDRLEVNVNQTVDIGGAIAEARKRALPTRYPDDIVDAELVEPTALIEHSASDPRSDAPETRDANELLSEDIFS